MDKKRLCSLVLCTTLLLKIKEYVLVFSALHCKPHFYIVHGGLDVRVKHPCVMLRHPCRRMAEYGGDILKRHAVGKRDGRCEGVAGGVGRQVLVYSAQVGYFFEVTVHSLVAHPWPMPC